MRNKWLILTMVFGITLQIAVCQLPIFHAAENRSAGYVLVDNGSRHVLQYYPYQ